MPAGIAVTAQGRRSTWLAAGSIPANGAAGEKAQRGFHLVASLSQSQRWPIADIQASHFEAFSSTRMASSAASFRKPSSKLYMVL